MPSTPTYTFSVRHGTYLPIYVFFWPEKACFGRGSLLVYYSTGEELEKRSFKYIPIVHEYFLCF